MPKYYCYYCKSYLTHDTLSVRQSHLMGRHHIRHYCDYYEQKARETGLWDALAPEYEVNLLLLNQRAPSPDNLGDRVPMRLPPPPHTDTMPNPLVALLRHTEEHQRAIYEVQEVTRSDEMR